MPERNCATCTQQQRWGCTAIKWRHPDKGKIDTPDNWIRPAALPVTILGETSYACPRQPLRENPQYWVKLFRFYGMFKQGFLPQAGAVQDQCSKAIDLFRIMDAAIQQCDRIEQEQMQKKNNRKSTRAR